jgi:hypothetical protein
MESQNRRGGTLLSDGGALISGRRQRAGDASAGLRRIHGRGKRLFEDGEDLKLLKLAEAKTTRTGVAILTYQPARTDGVGAAVGQKP